MSADANPPAGTRDFLPAEAARRADVFATVRATFERHGFAPLETPAFERLDVLTGKYGDEGDQLMFKILRRGIHEESGEADLALRYDLTVPLARVVARYGSQLPTPFRRYQVAPVWRADRPAKGRFREFVQCDVDTIGSDSLVADASTLMAIHDVLSALGLAGFRFQLNSRSALKGLIEGYGIDASLEGDTLVALDKLEKVGVDGVAEELRERGLEASNVQALASDLGEDAAGHLRERIAATEAGQVGLGEVDALLDLLDGVELTAEFTPTLARGLGYYTGPIFEVVHDELGSSIAAGGRYDGLVGTLGGPDTPACGGSVGLERVLAILGDGDDAPSGLDVLVTTLGGDAAALALANRVRALGWSTEAWTGSSGKLGTQLKYADRRAAVVALIQGEQELAAGTVTVKHLSSGDQQTVGLDDLADHLRPLLGPS